MGTNRLGFPFHDFGSVIFSNQMWCYMPGCVLHGGLQFLPWSKSSQHGSIDPALFVENLFAR
jgi:hypothetical protein